MADQSDYQEPALLDRPRLAVENALRRLLILADENLPAAVAIVMSPWSTPGPPVFAPAADGPVGGMAMVRTGVSVPTVGAVALL